jgi:hypothetical protein
MLLIGRYLIYRINGALDPRKVIVPQLVGGGKSRPASEMSISERTVGKDCVSGNRLKPWGDYQNQPGSCHRKAVLR